MIIRYGNENDLDKIKALWKYCFNDTDEFIKYYFAKRYIKSNNIVVEDGGKIVSSVQINPYKIKPVKIAAHIIDAKKINI